MKTKPFALLYPAAFYVVSILLALVGALFVLYLMTPDAAKLKDCLVTEMYQVHLCDTDPTFASFEQISPYIVGAVIMSEDASFYSHEGVDVNEMKESFIKNFELGKFARGGSTITQQLAKNVFLNGRKSIIRKIQEIFLAFQIEHLFTKKRILTLYLNVVEFGPNIYGVKQATQYYFGKPPSQVTPEEAAFIAFLLPNPKKYNQSFVKHQMTPFADKMVKRILHKMLLGHKISEDEYAVAESNVSAMFGGTSAQIQDTTPEDVESEQGDENDFKFESEL